jgi:ubiquinone/menaquinone biosynthesis C-methylase UbiE
MSKVRIAETDHGIEGEFNVAMYDQMQRNFRDKGIMQTAQIIRSGLDHGSVLEIGPGPGYLGLEWLKNTQDTLLIGAEISREMIILANQNAEEYGLTDRVSYVETDAQNLPFPDRTFDGVFTNGSLHEWSNPLKIFQEIHRVLKSGGQFYISDLRRDISWLIRQFMNAMVKPRGLRPGLNTSLRAAYTVEEIREMLGNTPLIDARVHSSPFGLQIIGRKKD